MPAEQARKRVELCACNAEGDQGAEADQVGFCGGECDEGAEEVVIGSTFLSLSHSLTLFSLSISFCYVNWSMHLFRARGPLVPAAGFMQAACHAMQIYLALYININV